MGKYEINYTHWSTDGENKKPINIVDQVGTLNLGQYTNQAELFYNNLFFNKMGTNLFNSPEHSYPQISTSDEKNSLIEILKAEVNKGFNITSKITDKQEEVIIQKLVKDLNASIENENYLYNVISGESLELDLQSVTKDNIDTVIKRYISFYRNFKNKYYNILKGEEQDSFILLLECLTENRLRPYVKDMSRYFNEFEIAKQIYDPKRMWERETDKTKKISTKLTIKELPENDTLKQLRLQGQKGQKKLSSSDGQKFYITIKDMVGKKNVMSIRKIFDKQTKEIDEIQTRLNAIYSNTTEKDLYNKIWDKAKKDLDEANAKKQKYEQIIEKIYKVLPTWNNKFECEYDSTSKKFTYTINNQNITLYIKATEIQVETKTNDQKITLNFNEINEIIVGRSNSISKLLEGLKNNKSSVYKEHIQNRYISNIQKNLENYFTDMANQEIQSQVFNYMNQFYESKNNMLNIKPTTYIKESFDKIKNKYENTFKNDKIKLITPTETSIEKTRELVTNIVLTTQLENTKKITTIEEKIEKEKSQLLKSFSNLVLNTYQNYKKTVFTFSNKQIQDESLPQNLSSVLSSIDDDPKLLEEFKEKFWELFEEWLRKIFTLYGVINIYNGNDKYQEYFKEGFKQMVVSFKSTSKVYIDIFRSNTLTQGFLGEYYINVLGKFLAEHGQSNRYTIVAVNNIGGDVVNNQQMSADNVFTIYDKTNDSYYSIGLQAKNPFKSHVSDNYIPYANKYSPTDKQILYYFDNNNKLSSVFGFVANNILLVPQSEQTKVMDILNSLLMIYYQNFGRIGTQSSSVKEDWVQDILAKIPQGKIENVSKDSFYISNSFLLSDSQVILPKSYIILGIISSILTLSDEPDINLKVDISSATIPDYDFTSKPFNAKTSNVVISSVTTWKNKKLSEQLQNILSK